MYKDIGRQGLVSVRPDTPYRRRFDDFVAKKNRLAADQWGSDGVGVAEVTQPVQDLIAREFPDFDPYPWGRDRKSTRLNSSHANISYAVFSLKKKITDSSSS